MSYAHMHDDFLQVFRVDGSWFWRMRSGRGYVILYQDKTPFKRRWLARRAAKKEHPGLRFRP